MGQAKQKGSLKQRIESALSRRNFSLNLHVRLDNMLLLRADRVSDDLDHEEISRHSGMPKTSFDNMHIYFVCRRKRMYFSGAFYLASRKQLVAEVTVNEIIHTLTIDLHKLQNFIPYEEPVAATVFDDELEDIKITYASGNVLNLDFHNITVLCNEHIPAIHNLDVLYIGKGYSDGGRNVFSRLSGHEKFTPIVAKRKDDERIYVLCFSLLFAVSCISGYGSSESLAARDRAQKGLLMTDVVDVAEALLISKFRPNGPGGNVKNVENFLTPAILDKMLKNGLLSMSLDFETTYIKHAVGTAHCSHSQLHVFNNFDLFEAFAEKKSDLSAGTSAS